MCNVDTVKSVWTAEQERKVKPRGHISQTQSFLMPSETDGLLAG